jgi:hypothetical protein
MELADLLTIKSELTNDPLSLGLTTNASDDEANANILNETRESILVYRASVPSDQINIPIDEFNAASAGQREWWAMQTADGSINPSVIATEFAKMFGSNTAARASFNAVAMEPASRARQLLERYVYLTPSDIANARQAT